MSIIATPFPNAEPPRVLIELASGSASVFTSIQLFRDSVPVRTQPTVGATTAVATDYFAGYQRTVTYRAVTNLGTYTTTVVLDVDRAWFIHASQPTFSVPLRKDGAAASIRAIGDIANPTGASVHTVIGSPLPVTKRTGARVAGSRTIRLQSFTGTEAAAIAQLLSDDSPVLIRLPESWQVRFTEGWYSIGAYGEDLPFDLPAEFYREWTLPAQQVVEPKLIVNQLWSWDALADSGLTWDSLPETFPSWYDLTVNNRVA